MRLGFLLFTVIISSVSAFAADESSAAMSAVVAARFKKLDVNGDGKLDASELAAFPILKALDLNGDGVVTLEEALAGFNNVGKLAAKAATPAESPKEGPRRLSKADGGIGARVPDFAFKDLAGKESLLSAVQEKRPVVVAMVSTSCPVSKRYLPTLAKLEAEYRAKGVTFLLVAPVPTDTAEDLRQALSAAGITAPCASDSSGEIARALGATASTDCFVIDAARTLAYRGAIDDQYGLGYQIDAPRHRYLALALDSALVGEAPAIVATEAPGCALDLTKTQTAAAASAPTYHNRISRIVQTNCQECHRTGGIAPFPLENYQQVSAKAGMIRKMVSRDLMPPWFAAAPAEGQHSAWVNDRSLSAHDKADLLAWLDNGKTEGDAADGPLPRHWPVDWQIGTPDAVVQIPQPISVAATGTMPYQNITVDTEFGEDKWVRGFEVRPTAREVVHHVLIFADEKGSQGHKADGLTNGFFAAYVPGSSSVIYPDGFAKPLPAGARLRFQIHYTPNGTATQDQVKIGLLFAKEAPKHVIHVAGIANVFLKIPPGADNYPVTGSIPVLRPVVVTAFSPHMHLRGKAFRFVATLPDGTTKTLLDVPRYDFNWQLNYRCAEPIALPLGSKVEATGWFDNSANNPANPDPTKLVRWGQQTTDEMMLGYAEYYFADEDGITARLSSTH